MKKKIEPAELTPSEREEMIRLRAENERLRAEIAVVKKEIALSAAYTPDMASRSLPEQPVSFLTCFAGNHLSAS